MDKQASKFFALVDLGGVGSYFESETPFDAIERCKKTFEADFGSLYRIDGEDFEIALFDVTGIKEFWWQNGRVFDGSGKGKEKEVKPLYYVGFRASTKKSKGRKAA